MVRTASYPLVFGTLLRNYRQVRNLTQEALAAAAGFSPVYIGLLERGLRTPPSNTVELLAAALKLTAAERAMLERAGRAGAEWSSDGSAHASSARAVGVLRPGHAGTETVRPVLLVTGARGSGKSRWLAQMAMLGRANSWAVCAGACSPTRDRAPRSLALLADAIRGGLGGLAPERLRTLLVGCDWIVRLLPELAGAMTGTAHHQQPAPEQEHRLIAGAAGRLLANLGGSVGTLLVLDDLQWTDGAALDLLIVLLREQHDPPLRLVGAYRPDAEHENGALAGWLADLAAARLAIGHSVDSWLRDPEPQDSLHVAAWMPAAATLSGRG